MSGLIVEFGFFDSPASGLDFEAAGQKVAPFLVEMIGKIGSNDAEYTPIE